MRWKEKEESKWTTRSISIVPPIEWEKLTKQAELIDAEKDSAKASERTSNATIFLAIAAVTSVVVTVWWHRREEKRRDISKKKEITEYFIG